MTKEEIQVQINILSKFAGFHIQIQILEEEKLLAKSIQDLQEEAFNASRQKEDFIPLISMGELKYKTFDDYLTHITNEKSIYPS